MACCAIQECHVRPGQTWTRPRSILARVVTARADILGIIEIALWGPSHLIEPLDPLEVVIHLSLVVSEREVYLLAFEVIQSLQGLLAIPAGIKVIIQGP